MSLAIAITVNNGSLRGLAGLRDGLQPSVLSEVTGSAVAVETRAHLRTLNRERPNQLGGRRTNFYGNASELTSYSVEGDTAIVSIAARGIRQRFYGGTIVPKRAKYLTIPVHPDAHGRTASQFKGLVVVFGKGGQPVGLARSVTARRSRGFVGPMPASAGELLFVFKKSITQAPDPTVLPPPDRTYGAAISRLNEHVDRLLRKAGTQ